MWCFLYCKILNYHFCPDTRHHLVHWTYLMICKVAALHLQVTLGASHLQTSTAVNLQRIHCRVCVCVCVCVWVCVPGCAVPLCAAPVALWEPCPCSRDRHTGSGCSAFHAGPSWPLQLLCVCKREGGLCLYCLLNSFKQLSNRVCVYIHSDFTFSEQVKVL